MLHIFLALYRRAISWRPNFDKNSRAPGLQTTKSMAVNKTWKRWVGSLIISPGTAAMVWFLTMKLHSVLLYSPQNMVPSSRGVLVNMSVLHCAEAWIWWGKRWDIWLPKLYLIGPIERLMGEQSVFCHFNLWLETMELYIAGFCVFI